ncbi:MAG: hypothetical protein WC584_01840 [Candidatus Pacearchaeota archaeon]
MEKFFAYKISCFVRMKILDFHVFHIAVPQFEEVQKKTSKVSPFEVAKIPKEFLAPAGFFYFVVKVNLTKCQYYLINHSE